MKTLKFLSYLTVVLAIVVAGCTEEVGPKLPDFSEFIAPVLTSPETADPVEFLPEDAAEVFEVFEWDRTDYGGTNLSTNYVIEIDDDEDFSSPQSVSNTSADSLEISVEDFNDAMLALGLIAFEEHTVFVRVKSTVNGITNDPLFSNAVERTATIYQLSECGDFCTIGIIGSATPGGWSTDVDFRLSDPTKVDKHSWTVTVYLTTGGEVKFRSADDWPDNWGGNSFPTGTGVYGGGNIALGAAASGYYKVDFNDVTLAYTFTAVTGSYPTVGIIGSATPGGWDNDTDLTQDGSDPHVWTGTFTLVAGEAKFRANNAWDNNWGATTYPSGYGTSGGPNIPIAVGGTYFVYFNDATGEYFFGPTANAAAYADIGIIGSATPGGWDNDTNLIKNPANPYKWSKYFTLTEAEAKFRADNAWTVNWGAGTFPGGVGTLNGANIPVKEGYYFVTFNTLSGEYYFLK
jgi:hypothetical protein